MKCSKFSTRDRCLLFFIQWYFSQLASKLVFCLNQGCTKFKPRIKTCSSRNQIFYIGHWEKNTKTIMTLQPKEKTSQQNFGWKLFFQPSTFTIPFEGAGVPKNLRFTSRFLAPRKSPRKIQPKVGENLFSFEKHHFGRKIQLSHLRGTVLIIYPQNKLAEKCFAKSWQDRNVQLKKLSLKTLLTKFLLPV